MKLFESYRRILRGVQPVGILGRVSAVRGLTVSVADFPAPMGAGCRIAEGGRAVYARVVGFAGKNTLVMPLGPMTGISRGDRVVLTATEQTVGLCPEMLGRMFNGLGEPIDARGPLQPEARTPAWPKPLPPTHRRRVCEPLPTGVRAIDAMLTVGKGQRMGIFASSGLGKSMLLGMIARRSSADVTVVALIGERGREVADFVEKHLGPQGMKKAVVVAATGAEPPVVRVQAGAVATAIAEYFRDRGGHVLLLVDSLTRLAAAQRQIGLAAGEPPATKGYTPSVFGLLPELLERCGPTPAGSITGFYTVLLEGDDLSDPVSDAVRAVTDGHIVLSRPLAARGHYPAVDVSRSVSRAMIDVVAPEQLAAAREVQGLLATHEGVEELLDVGAYRSGASAEVDLAVRMMPAVRAFLAQGLDEPAPFEETQRRLASLRQQIVAARKKLAPRAKETSQR